MAKLTPQQAAQKWSNRISAASTDIANGVDNVSVAPTQLAAAKKDKMLANLTKAVQSGKWEAGLRAVDLQQWKNAMKTKGIPRIASGANEAVPKMTTFLDKLFTYQDSVLPTIQKMPDMTLEENINRAVAWMRAMNGFKK